MHLYSVASNYKFITMSVCQLLGVYTDTDDKEVSLPYVVAGEKPKKLISETDT